MKKNKKIYLFVLRNGSGMNGWMSWCPLHKNQRFLITGLWVICCWPTNQSIHSHFHPPSFHFHKDNSAILLLFNFKERASLLNWNQWRDELIEGNGSAARGAAAHNPQKKRNKLLFFNPIKQMPQLLCLMDEERRAAPWREEEEKRRKL